MSISCSKDICQEVVGKAVKPFIEDGYVGVNAGEVLSGLR